MAYKFILVENRTSVLLGPMFWRPRMFQSDVDDLEVAYVLPQADPEGYLLIASNPDGSPSLEVFPVTEVSAPTFDPFYEYLSGPTFEYVNGTAIESWTKDQKALDDVKRTVIDSLASVRYMREVGGAKATVQGQEVTVDTSRDGRNVFVQQYVLMGDTDTVDWKFPEAWLNLTKSDLGQCVAAGVLHVKAAFTWEQSTTNDILAVSSVQELQALYQSIMPATPARGV